jgi:hypothetical protein
MLDALYRDGPDAGGAGGAAAGGMRPAIGDAPLQGSFLGPAGGILKRSVLMGSAFGGVAPNPVFVALLDQALRSLDPVFHDALYGWLSDTPGLAGLLPGIATPFVETFLRRRMPKDSKTLLFAYLIANKQYAQAALEMYRLATEVLPDPSSNLPLGERAKLMALAISKAKDSSVQLHGAIPATQVAQMEEEYNLLLIQSDIAARMRPLPGQLRATRQPADADKADAVDRALLVLATEPVTLGNLWGIVSQYGLLDCQIAVQRESARAGRAETRGMRLERQNGARRRPARPAPPRNPFVSPAPLAWLRTTPPPPPTPLPLRRDEPRRGRRAAHPGAVPGPGERRRGQGAGPARRGPRLHRAGGVRGH